MSFGTVGTICLVAYLLALVAVAEVARRARRDRTPADHFLAGRSLGLFVLLLTLYATTFSGNSLLGYPGEGYRRGYAWIVSTGMMMTILVVFHLLVPKLRSVAVRENFVTPGDWVRYRFGEGHAARRLRVAVAAVMMVALGNYLLAQLMAMGHVTSEVTGGQVPYAAAVLGLAVFILMYETVGGMRAVAWTDTAQGLLMLVGLFLLLRWVVGEGEGLSGLAREVAVLRPDATAVPSRAEQANWVSTFLLVGFAAVMYPQAIQRVFAAKNARTLKRSLALMGFMPLTTTLVVMLIGIAAIPRFQELGAIQADTVMPRLLADWASLGTAYTLLAVTVFIGALAAIMSTADSVLLSLGSITAGDLLGRDRHDPATTGIGKRAAAWVMLAVTLLALEPALTLWRLTELKMEILVQAAPAFLLAIHWGGQTARGTLAGLAVGVVIATGAALLGIKRIEGVHVGLLAVAANALVVVAASLLDPSRHAAAPETGS